MATGTTTLKELQTQLRAMIQEYTHGKVSPDDMRWILNRKAYRVFVLLPKDMKEYWYGKTAILSVTQNATTGYWDADIPTDMWDIVAIKRHWTDDPDDFRADLKKIDLSSLEECIRSAFKDEEEYTIFGESIITTYVASPDGSVICYYIRSATKMTQAIDLVDIPDMYLDVVLALSAIDAIASVNIDDKEKQTAMQLFAMMASEASKIAGLSLQSTLEDKAAAQEAGIPFPVTAGGSKGDRAIIS